MFCKYNICKERKGYFFKIREDYLINQCLWFGKKREGKLNYN